MSVLKAVRAHCLECCCGDSKEVKLCPVEKCALYKYRLGHNPDRTRSMTDEQKQAATDRLELARLAKKSLNNNVEKTSQEDD